MSRFNSIEMAQDVASHNNISIEKSFFGLFITAHYTVTGSIVDSFMRYYSKENVDALNSLIAVNEEKVGNLVNKIRLILPKPTGPYRLEYCMSRDHRFLALQLYQYINFMYYPITGIKYFEGDAAKCVATLLE